MYLWPRRWTLTSFVVEMVSFTRYGTWTLEGTPLRDGDLVEFRIADDWLPAVIICGGCAVEKMGAAGAGPGHNCADVSENLTLVMVGERRIEIRRVPRSSDVDKPSVPAEERC